MSKTVSAVVVCAGNATRMQGIDKIFAKVCGKPVILWTLENCQKSTTITDIIVVTKPENKERITDLAIRYGITKLSGCVDGGACRAESVLHGALCSQCDYLSIMDGARPVTSPYDIDKTSFAAFEYGAAALGIPMTDTVKRIDQNEIILDTVDRSKLVRIQTPQTFEREKYISYAKKAAATDVEFTDDCSVYEYFGEKVKIVKATNENFKITEQKDLDMFARLVTDFRAVRVGHGYDVHKLVEGRKLILCGETIDFELGLLGHSDADVALHALMDAMLGAAAFGDIGRLFPDTDNNFKDISSMLLLEKVCEKVFERFEFVNCDITIIAQKPKLLPHIPKMRENVARVIGTSIDRINIKATTEEKLGFTGKLEGISSHAVCTLFERTI